MGLTALIKQLTGQTWNEHEYEIHVIQIWSGKLRRKVFLVKRHRGFASLADNHCFGEIIACYIGLDLH